ncbi:MAG: hypothetical protein ACI9HE_002736 [Planctomycetota bacterium]|jgi:hypothetical protein
MDTRQIEVKCPCCESMLVIDVRTSSVLKHAPPQQLDETGRPILDAGRWKAATERVNDRGERGGDIFDTALGKEHSRDEDLDDLFKKAKDKMKRRQDENDAGF